MVPDVLQCDSDLCRYDDGAREQYRSESIQLSCSQAQSGQRGSYEDDGVDAEQEKEWGRGRKQEAKIGQDRPRSRNANITTAVGSRVSNEVLYPVE